MSVKGVDVSVHNGDVDYKALKDAGIEFVIIRCGYGQDRKSQDDKQFNYHLKQCEEHNIPFGVYLYSYANTVKKAVSEADHVLRLLNGMKPAYGVWFDVEDVIHPHDEKLLTDIVVAFCEKIESSGLYVGVYSSKSWFENRFDKRIDNYDKWVAQWSSKCTYKGEFGIWQFTDNLKIGGKRFDGNLAYKDYPKLTGGVAEPSKPSETPIPKKKSNEEIVIEVINGKWGAGSERKQNLTKAGYNYNTIQKRVNKYYELAEACVNGDYGNGNARKSKVTKAGYDYKTVQLIVNDITGK